MPRINLLPWREEDRKRRQREFLVAMSGALVAGVVVVGVIMFAFAQMIDGQRGRNARLTEEIAVLDKSIAEIDGLERTRTEERRFVRWGELSRPWLLAAFACLFVQLFLDSTWLRRIP